MRRVLTLVFRQKQIQPSNMMRAPKKGKQVETATSEDLINIYKDRKDPEIFDIDQYPVWLLELGLPLIDPYNAVISLTTRDPGLTPEAFNIPHLIRNSKRMRIQEFNKLTQLKESNDEFTYTANIDIENAVEARNEELALAERDRTLAEDASAVDDDEDDEDAPKVKRIVIDKEKEKKEEEEFKAKLYAKKKDTK